MPATPKSNKGGSLVLFNVSAIFLRSTLVTGHWSLLWIKVRSASSGLP